MIIFLVLVMGVCGGCIYLDAEIGVQERLKLKRLVAVVGDDNGGGQALAGQGDAVEEAKLVGPGLAVLVGERLGREAKVELDVGAVALAGRLAEELPARVAREAVLRELLGGLAVAACAKDLWYGDFLSVLKGGKRGES